MAYRNTLKEAEELMSKYEAEYRGHEFRIDDKSSIRVMGKGAAEMNGYEVIEQVNRLQVLAKETRFEVSQVRHCAVCEAELLSSDIGESGYYTCSGCKAETGEDTGTQDAAIAMHMTMD